MLGSATVPVTGGWETFTNVTGTVSGAAGRHHHAVPDLRRRPPARSSTWTPSPSPPAAQGGGTGPITGLAGKCLDVAGGAPPTARKIQIYTCNGTAAQTWTVTAERPDRAFGKCLDVAGGATANGTKVAALDLQRHRRPELVGAGRRHAANPQSGKCLDVSDNSSADGQHVHIWDCIGAPPTRSGVPAMIGKARCAALVAGVAVPPVPPAPAAADDPYDVLVFSKTAGFRHDSIAGRHPGRSATWARRTTSPSTATEDATAFTTANLAQYKAVVFLSTTGDVLNATQQTAFESYIAAAAATSACTRPPTPSTTGRSTASWSAPTSPPTRRSSRPPSAGRGPGARGDRAPAADLDPHRRVVQLPHQPPLERARAGDPRREHRTPAAAWAPTTRITWCKTYQRRPLVLHRPRAHPGVVRRPGLPRAPARRHPVRGRPVQRRLPPGDRLHRALQRLDHRLVAGRSGQLHQHRRHAHLDRRHGPAAGTAPSSSPPTR